GAFREATRLQPSWKLYYNIDRMVRVSGGQTVVVEVEAEPAAPPRPSPDGGGSKGSMGRVVPAMSDTSVLLYDHP
ncbi:MAG: hypothetical protein PHU25_08140, partial [Deltaproteobacteria bacterium]|nr:hypothetical protein [Deltaproteobacteria bacterium]